MIFCEGIYKLCATSNFNMKNIIITYLIFGLSIVQAQDLSFNTFNEVDSIIEPQIIFEVLITKELENKEDSNCLIYECKKYNTILYCDENTDENYVEFQELGRINNTEIVVINKFTYNEEFYILIDKKDCNAITLDGFPIGIENTNLYIVYNNPPTDHPWKIQILKIDDGIFLLNEIAIPYHIRLKKVLRVDQFELYLQDINNKIWKTYL
jgi:hypothetical protein